MPVPLRPFAPLLKIFSHGKNRPPTPTDIGQNTPQSGDSDIVSSSHNIVRRHFYNERGFQTYGSFFKYWNGWITAAHVLEESKNLIPPFADGAVLQRPQGLDAALIGCDLPNNPPANPKIGQAVYCIGYPAGSDKPAKRTAKIYLERPAMQDQWIAHIFTPDEPVVTGMSGGCVFDENDTPIGILITRNSPADLNNDRDPDESFDFISLSGVWHAINSGNGFV